MARNYAPRDEVQVVRVCGPLAPIPEAHGDPTIPYEVEVMTGRKRSTSQQTLSRATARLMGKDHVAYFDAYWRGETWRLITRVVYPKRNRE